MANNHHNKKSRIFREPLVILLLTGTMLFYGCNEIKKPEEKVKYVIPDSLLNTLVIDTVKKCPLVNIIKLTGMVDFNQDKQVNIYSLVSGNIQDIKVQLGDFVNKGQVLAVVKSGEMAGYGYNLVVAESNVKTTRKQLDASGELFKSGLTSIMDLTNAQAAYDQAMSQLETAKRVLKINGNNANGDYIIKSPISGFIVQKNVTNNTLVRLDNGTSLFTVSDLNDVWVQGNVYEANLGQVHVGDMVEVRILSAPDQIFRGKIDKILNVLDPASKVNRVRVVLKNSGYQLKPQMFASLLVSNPENREALCLLSKSLIYDRSRYYVLVEKGKGEAEIRPVEILNSLEDKTYVRSGVMEGERVIASNALQIYSELNN
ncbi:MAG: efflux RND transporter periplasmic adaptor subunit [Bacteroidia bacterium]|nr:efflux RND transporter periplasmic adaptor subunit [Bacteroidia bacterium]